MPIATFGTKVFEASSNKIYTFDGFSKSTSLDVENQELENNKPSTYIKGYALDQIGPLTLMLDSRFVDVEAEIQDWNNICLSKIPQFFIMGGKLIGQNKFLLKSVNESEAIINNLGKKIKTKLELSFEEFVRYGYKQDKATKGTQTASSGGIDYSQVLDLTMKRDNINATDSINAGIQKE